jgi:hypothetical protein
MDKMTEALDRQPPAYEHWDKGGRADVESRNGNGPSFLILPAWLRRLGTGWARPGLVCFYTLDSLHWGGEETQR